MSNIRRRLIGITVLLALLSLIAFFYIFSINSASLRLLLVAYLISVAVDAFILALHVPRAHPHTYNEKFDPSKLTILIICYNGADIIRRTLEDAMKQVPADQIIVVSDRSTDKTVEIARSMGVQVFENERNYGKSMSINKNIHRVKTPYVLILDDDTLIGKTFLPTSRLDAGYSAVAFNVVPVPTRHLINKFQQFEYSKSMIIRKGLRAMGGSVGNVSGAIGLYHTAALQKQANKHSGQSGGEDQQRTLLTHLESEGLGVTYYDSVVETLAPNSFKELFKQRAFKWNTSNHENFTLIIRTILHPKTPAILKIEKAYSLFILLTEPFRMLFFYLILFAPIGSFITHLALITAFYIIIELIAWFKADRISPLWLVIIFPLYAKFCSVARFIAHFYWYKKKYKYSVKSRHHRLISGRRLLREYATVTMVLATLWTIASYKLFTLLQSQVSTAKSTDYSIPMWQPLEGLPVNINAAEVILAFLLIVAIATRGLKLIRFISKAVRKFPVPFRQRTATLSKADSA